MCVSSDNGRFTYPEQIKSLLQDFKTASLINGLRYRSKNISSDRLLHLVANEETNSKQAAFTFTSSSEAGSKVNVEISTSSLSSA
ncbi:hypothetical protein RO3G_04051 [Rhizopus delemar RA 99-880]|uniref:Uncharacterized protein n=1 Tax=Rhizopus delemar (strain RA 99-880 / ATCC MYA-4621 / FGSC 9543 / NRRL 43880) TaxID=246409 RepID=I1BT16_RHIO9|nr:hypothetical protein RO3G_04051 [Rhizopus delemar RA 99-880]|eukprot:EIE79346.1 hypothetical protein RO3G_04051 [Rhizopus delemar RA 99-880]